MGIVGGAVNAVKSVGVLPLVGDVINVTQGASDYKASRKQGDSKAVSIAKAAGSFAFYEMAGVWGLGVAAVQIGATLASSSAEHTTRTMTNAYNRRGKLGSGYFDMTQAGYTMRQRSLNAIRNNGLNTQSVLGNEARTYFRSV